MKKIAEMLRSMNAVFGRGDIAKISWKHGFVIQKLQYGTGKRSFRITDDGFVVFLQHKRKIKGFVEPESKCLSCEEPTLVRLLDEHHLCSGCRVREY